MTCKWCDAELTNGSDICPICGKDQTVASVLDTTPELLPAERPRRSWDEPSVKPEKTAPARRPARTETAKRKKKNNLISWIALLLALIMLVVLLISNAKMSGRISQLESQVASLQGTPATEPEPTELVETTEATQSPADLLTSKEIRVEFVCDPKQSTMSSADTAGIAVNMPCKLDPSVREDGVSFVGTVCYESETHCEVRLNLTKDEGNGLLLEVSYDVIFSYLLGEHLANTQPFTVRWRVPGEETWHPMETSGVITQQETSEATKAQYLIACGDALPDTDKTQIELQVEICRANDNGGSLTVILGTPVVDLRTGEITFG